MNVRINNHNTIDCKYVRNLYEKIHNALPYDKLLEETFCTTFTRKEVDGYHVCIKDFNIIGLDIYPYITVEINGENKITPITTTLLALYKKTPDEFEQDWRKQSLVAFQLDK